METTTDTNTETTPERKNGIYVDNNGKSVGVVIVFCIVFVSINSIAEVQSH